MRSQETRVLGVDPGLTRCGIGVVDGSVGRPLTLVDVQVARTPADLDIAERLRLLEEQIEAAVTTHRPDVVAIERVFSQHNVRTVMGTAQASAVAMLVAARHGIDVRLPEADVDRALTTLVDLDRQKKLLSRDIAAIDLRLPDRVTVRLSDEAAQAREDALKPKKKKGGAA